MVASQVLLNKDCYSQIEDYKKKVVGHLIKAECYISERYFHNAVKDGNVSRCGECLEITGPTQNPFSCVVAGSFYTKPKTNLTEFDLSRIIFVDDDNYNYIATIVHGAINHATQVTVRSISCPFEYKPSIVVVDVKEDTVLLQPVNSANMHKLLIVNSVPYFIKQNGLYEIPKSTELVSMKLIDINERVVLFKDVNITNNGSIKLAESQFSKDTSSENCVFVPQEIVLNEEVTGYVPTPIVRYYTWTPFVVLPDGSTYQYNIFGITNISIPNGLNKALFYWWYPSVVKMSETYKDLVVHFEYDNLDFTFDSPSLTFFDYNIQLGTKYGTVCTDMMTRIEHFPNKTSALEVSLSKRECQGYANVFEFTVTTTGNTNLRITEAHYTYHESFKNEIECDPTTFSCHKMECIPPNLYKKGCEPECGTCSAGYECSSNGECVIKPKLNTRNGSCLPLVLLVFSLLLLI